MICCSFVKKRFFFSFQCINELLSVQERRSTAKAKEKYDNSDGKEKAAKYYIANKDVLKEKARNRYRNLSEKEREAKRQYSRDKYKEMKKNANLFLSCINE